MHNRKILNSFDFQAGESIGDIVAPMRSTSDGRADRFSQIFTVSEPLSEHLQTLLLLLTVGAKIEEVAPIQAPF